MGAPYKYEALQGGFHGDPYHSTYLGLISNDGGKDRVENLLVKQCRKPPMMGKQKQMVNKGDSSAHGKANLCSHPHADLLEKTVRKTAGCIDSRLT